jgi:hypothetical protein
MSTTPISVAERGVPVAAIVRQPALDEASDSAYGRLENQGNAYFSPVIRIDNETSRAVLQYRDPDTGEVLRQYPSATTGAYAKRAEQAKNDAAPARHSVDTIDRAPVKAAEGGTEETVRDDRTKVLA